MKIQSILNVDLAKAKISSGLFTKEDNYKKLNIVDMVQESDNNSEFWKIDFKGDGETFTKWFNRTTLIALANKSKTAGLKAKDGKDATNINWVKLPLKVVKGNISLFAA